MGNLSWRGAVAPRLVPGAVSKLGFSFVGKENKPAMRECPSR
nr:hypothetical protein RVX_2233 [Nitratidesulfovibrio sp. HK-II]